MTDVAEQKALKLFKDIKNQSNQATIRAKATEGIKQMGFIISTPNMPEPIITLATNGLTATSFVIEWDSPVGINRWNVYLNGVLVQVLANDPLIAATLTYTFPNLQPLTPYVVHLASFGASNLPVFSVPFNVSTAANAPPIWNLAGPGFNITVNVPYSFNLNAICSDVDSNSLTYSVVSGAFPPGVSLNGATGEVAGTATGVGSFPVTLRANDGFVNTDEVVPFAVVDPDVTAPTVPQNVASSLNVDQVTLTWDSSTDAENEVDYYKVWRSQDGGAYVLRTTTDLLTYQEFGLVGGTYCYKVSAVDTSGNANESALSLATCETVVPPIVITTPINFAVTANSLIELHLTWQPGPGGDPPTEYRIYRAATEAGTYTLRDTVLAPTLQDDDAIPSGETRWYKISAFASGTESGQTVVPISGTGVDPPIGGTLIFSDGFETGTVKPASSPFPGGWHINSSGADANCFVTVKSVGGGSPGSTGFYLESTIIAAPNNYRVEAHARVNSQPMSQILQLGVPYYFGVSIRLPTGFVLDDLTGDILMQWHFQQVGPPADSIHAGHYTLSINQGNWFLNIHRGEGGDLLGGSTASLGSWAADVNQWVRWVYRFVFAASNGAMKIWKNPTAESSPSLVNQTGIRTYNTAGGHMPNVHMGLYKSQWRTGTFANTYDAGEVPNVSPRRFHHDNLRIATTFDLVK